MFFDAMPEQPEKFGDNTEEVIVIRDMSKSF